MLLNIVLVAITYTWYNALERISRELGSAMVMKVLVITGSPHRKGTFALMAEKNRLLSKKGRKDMKYKVKVTVLDKKLYPELQKQYCADPASGACPCYNVGDEFVFYRDDERDDFWHMGLNTLVKTDGDSDAVAGGPKMPFCSEAWDAISRYIYTGLQGGSIMKGWMKNENEMITCCSDGTRPVIFKIERIDYE